MEAQLHRKDEAQNVNESPAVRSGLAEPTMMGTPVLAEDLYATHSDIVDPLVRSFAQWEDEERHGAPPPLSTEYETHLTDFPPHAGQYSSYGGQGVDRDQTKPGGLERYDTPRPLSAGYGTDPPHFGHQAYGEDVDDRGQFEGSFGDQTSRVEEEEEGHGSPPHVGSETHWTDLPRDTTDTGNEDVGITGVLQSLDKMKVFNEPETKSSQPDQNEPKVYTGSHDQFAPEPVETPPLDTIAANPSNPNSSYTQRISSATSAIAEKAAAVKDSIVSKLNSSNKTSTKSSLPTNLSHKVADTLSGTLGPVYEKVAETGSSVMSKMHGSGHDNTADTAGSPKAEGKGIRVKEYLVETFKPGDDDKMLSNVITNALHRGKGSQSRPQESSTTTTTTYVLRDEGERRLQDSGN